MSYAFDMPYGGELVADPPSHAFGQPWPTATPESLAICRDLGLRELSSEDVDFEQTTHKKFYVKGEGYRRYHAGLARMRGRRRGRLLLRSASRLSRPAPSAERREGQERAPRRCSGRTRGGARPAHSTQLDARSATGAPTPMSRLRRKYLRAVDWEAVRAAEGIEAAGLPPPGARTDLNRLSGSSNLPVAPMIFGAAVERPEHKAERERRLRLARLLKKHGLDDRTGPIGWRI